MSTPFVQVHIPLFFSRFREEVEGLQDKILARASPILLRAEQASIRERFYRSGATLRSLKQQTVPIKGGKAYQLFPTATSKRGAPYPLFGEFGTGRRGALTGKPTPKGYRYGQSAGMAARRFSRIAVQQARPKVIQAAQQVVNEFARNITVK